MVLSKSYMSEPIMGQLAVVDDASKCHGILDLRTIRGCSPW
jgi:hypothetical protein